MLKQLSVLGLKNVVDLSSIGANNPQAGVLYAYHWIEDQLKELEDVNVAFIRPVGFYSNLYANINTIRADHAIYSNIPETITQRWAAPQDIAAVVLKLLQHVPVGTSVHYVYSDAFSTQNLLKPSRIHYPCQIYTLFQFLMSRLNSQC